MNCFSIKNWLVLLFIVTCGIVFERAIQTPHDEYDRLHAHWALLLKKKGEALQTQQNLKRHVTSLNDPAWIEFILMKELGLVPQMQIKFVFEEEM